MKLFLTLFSVLFLFFFSMFPIHDPPIKRIKTKSVSDICAGCNSFYEISDYYPTIVDEA